MKATAAVLSGKNQVYIKEVDILSGTKEEAVSTADINKVVFACDAGLGSSAMGATSFRKSTGSKSGNSYCNNSKLFKRSEHR